MEKRIALEKRGRTDDQITELILDNCRSTYIDGLTDEFTALETLSLINVGLVSLKNFPKLSNLRKLELSDNRISNGLNHLTKSSKLTHLNLSGNRIADFEELRPLKDLENLECLDLFNNQVTLTENYRDKMFTLIPSLSHLDGFDKDFSEVVSDEDEDVAEEAEEEDSCDEDSDVSLAFLYNDRCADDEVDEEWKCALERDLYNPPSSSSDSECEACEEDDEDDQSISDGGEEQDKKEQDEVKEKDSEGTTDKAEASSKTTAATDATDKDATAATKEHESEEARGKKRKLEDADTDG
ncbi:acidic leucine-rich nuclear phosphoprotein 32 family member A isoform X2 [Anopheles cruzii]|uniref:acidic leucine-rich nuclear phosphoprotein 32 family member A isoform X2 n=1 Tax=Anopheles cruzii TaxID=68878 RepID=UPI0022EC3D8C|nr:acidic leucine-rich nuclear phosphoprotein 32 family member A isoform X2 [Anopheles cruzii]